MAPIRVLVADSERLFAECLAICLRTYCDLDVIEEYPTTGPDTVTAARHKPDVAVIDTDLPEMGAFAVAAMMLARSPATRIVAVSDDDITLNEVAAGDAGAWIGLEKRSFEYTQLASIVRWADVAERRTHDDSRFPSLDRLELVAVPDSDSRFETEKRVVGRFSTLTPRETEILSRLAEGRTAQEIALALAISVSTVNSHVHSVLRKTRTGSKVEVVAMARGGQFVTDPAWGETTSASKTKSARPEVERTSAGGETKVLVTDRRVLFAQSLAGALNLEPGMTDCRRVASTLPAAVEQAELEQPDVVVLDAAMVDMDVRAAVHAIRQASPSTRVLVSCSRPNRVDLVRAALGAGAVGYLPASFTVEQAAEAVRLTAAGDGATLEAIAGALPDGQDDVAELRRRLDSLTPREAEVLDLLDKGLLPKQIAVQLHIRPSTVKSTMREVRRKLGARTQLEAVALKRRATIQG